MAIGIALTVLVVDLSLLLIISLTDMMIIDIMDPIKIAKFTTPIPIPVNPP